VDPQNGPRRRRGIAVDHRARGRSLLILKVQKIVLIPARMTGELSMSEAGSFGQ
jgi:hypothetical protein